MSKPSKETGASNSKRRTRRDPRKAATTEAILDAAEYLIAKNGINGITFKDIGKMIGSSNRNVVQYHIGDINDVIRRIIERRLPELEKKRETLFNSAKSSDQLNDIPTLMNIIFRPIFEITDADGYHVYAGFLAEIYRSGYLDIRSGLNANAPITYDVMNLLRIFSPADSQEVFSLRFRVVTQMFLSCLANSFNIKSYDNDFVYDELVLMASAAFTARIV